jgi:hypothetical protein
MIQRMNLDVVSQLTNCITHEIGQLEHARNVPSIVLHVTVRKPVPNEFHLRMVLSETAAKCGTTLSQGMTRIFGRVDINNDQIPLQSRDIVSMSQVLKHDATICLFLGNCKRMSSQRSSCIALHAPLNSSHRPQRMTTCYVAVKSK